MTDRLVIIVSSHHLLRSFICSSRRKKSEAHQEKEDSENVIYILNYRNCSNISQFQMRERERGRGDRQTDILPFHIVIFHEKTKPTDIAGLKRIFIQKHNAL